MQAIIDYRRLMLNLVTTVVALGYLLVANAVFHGSEMFLFVILGCAFQFMFNYRRSWTIYVPLTYSVVSILVLVSGIPELASYAPFSMLALVGWFFILIIGLLIELVQRLYLRYRIKYYSKQLNESGEMQGIYISDQMLIQSGLDESERVFFRREFKNSYEQLSYLRSARRDVLKYLPDYDQDLHTIDMIFHELLEEPRQLLSLSDFLYNDLPDYVSLVQSLLRMDNNLVQAEDDQTTVQKAQEKVKAIAIKLQQDYVIVTDKERADLKEKLN